MPINAEMRHAILGWSYLADTEVTLSALRRLSTAPAAVDAWSKIADLPMKTLPYEGKTSAWRIAHNIAREAISYADLPKSALKTKAEIVAAAGRAADLARELSGLIRDTSTLQFTTEDLMFERERQAMAVMLRRPDRFSVSTEEAQELTTMQQRDFPNAKVLTVSEAYRFLQYRINIREDVFALRLLRFADMASDSKRSHPIAPHPGAKATPAKLFAIAVADILDYATGSPRLPIVRALVGVVFQGETPTNDVIKQWWRRRGDKS